MTERTTGVRVLFTGQYWPGANTVYIARAFERCGAIVRILNDTTLWPGWVQGKGRISRRLLRPLIESEWNQQLLDLVKSFAPDLVYLTNADFCRPETLKTIRNKSIPIMCFYHDVLWENRQGSHFSDNISYFDMVATTRSWQEVEFKAAGANAVSIVRFGYEPLVHRPLKVSAKVVADYGADVTFIGTYEPHRAAELESLVADDFPYQFRLWGGYWDQIESKSPLRRYWQGREVHEQEIPVIYAASKVALHWLGWEPRSSDTALQRGDQHNSRTFQIPACGGAMMIAQSTDEQKHFFEEDVEAVYFDNVKELGEKLAYWLDPGHKETCKSIALAARARCLAEDYSYVPVVRGFLEHFGLPIIKNFSSKNEDIPK